MFDIHKYFGSDMTNDYDRFVALCNQYYAPTPADRLFKVPVAEADDFSRLVNKFKRGNVKIIRRAGGGPRYDSGRQTCLVKDAKWFAYYLRQPRRPYTYPLRVDPKVSNKELMDICDLYDDDSDPAVNLRMESLIRDYRIGGVDADWLRSLI